MSVPSPERQAELEAVYERQKASNAPYKDVQIRTLGELLWIMQQRQWSGEFDTHQPGGLLSGKQPANLRGIMPRDVNLSGARLAFANLSEANLAGANLSGAVLNFSNLSEATLEAANLSG